MFYVIKRNGHVFKQFDASLEIIIRFDSILGILFGGILGIRFILLHAIVRLDEILLNNVCVL